MKLGKWNRYLDWLPSRTWPCNNLFVTSKIEFSNSQILQFLNLKCFIEAKEHFETFFNGVLILIYYFKKYFTSFLILKAFCSTLDSRLGELENSISDVTNREIVNILFKAKFFTFSGVYLWSKLAMSSLKKSSLSNRSSLKSINYEIQMQNLDQVESWIILDFYFNLELRMHLLTVQVKFKNMFFSRLCWRLWETFFESNIFSSIQETIYSHLLTVSHMWQQLAATSGLEQSPFFLAFLHLFYDHRSLQAIQHLQWASSSHFKSVSI